MTVYDRAAKTYKTLNDAGRSHDECLREAVNEALDERDKLLAEMTKLWSMFVAQCESMEDEPDHCGEVDSPSFNFMRGSKSAAKRIRRSVDHPKYNAHDFPTALALLRALSDGGQKND